MLAILAMTDGKMTAKDILAVLLHEEGKKTATEQRKEQRRSASVDGKNLKISASRKRFRAVFFWQ
jgi:hypothetical protein